jgi:hypothetical protein
VHHQKTRRRVAEILRDRFAATARSSPKRWCIISRKRGSPMPRSNGGGAGDQALRRSAFFGLVRLTALGHDVPWVKA